jgi:hypothetical protein
LEEHLRVTGRKVALPIELCVCALLELAMEEEGLFRVAGGNKKINSFSFSNYTDTVTKYNIFVFV